MKIDRISPLIIRFIKYDFSLSLYPPSKEVQEERNGKKREGKKRGGEKVSKEEGERGGRATGLENERRDMPVNGNGLECTRRVNQKKEKSREGRKRGEGKRERERE